jgi:hypothetical protein
MMKISMKILIAGALMALSTIPSLAQEAVLATGGESQGTGGSSACSVGQIAVETYAGDSVSVAEGVQQPYEISQLTGLEKAAGVNLVYQVYPNPAKALVVLEVEYAIQGNLIWSLFDMKGNLLEFKPIDEEKNIIAMEHLAPAIYILKVSDQHEILKSFKIIKN